MGYGGEGGRDMAGELRQLGRLAAVIAAIAVGGVIALGFVASGFRSLERSVGDLAWAPFGLAGLALLAAPLVLYRQRLRPLLRPVGIALAVLSAIVVGIGVSAKIVDEAQRPAREAAAREREDVLIRRLGERRKVVEAWAALPENLAMRRVALSWKLCMSEQMLDRYPSLTEGTRLNREDLPDLFAAHPDLSAWAKDPRNEIVRRSALDTLDDMSRMQSGEPNPIDQFLPPAH